MSVTREVLYNEVWAQPMIVVAARYEVSGNFLARVCQAMNVPHPPRGYWAKLRAGTAPKKPALPAPTADHATEWTKGAMPFTPVRPMTDSLPPPGLKRRKWARPERHPLVDGVTPLFEAAYMSDSGYLRPRKRTLPDVFASKQGLEGALALASELYLALEDRGYKVTLASDGQATRRADIDHRGRKAESDYYTRERWSPSRPTVVILGLLAIGISIYELSEEKEMRHVGDAWIPASDPRPKGYRHYWPDWTHKRDVPTGRYVVRASSPYGWADWEQEWREDKQGQLLTKVKGICSEIESAAPALVALIEEGKRKAEEQRIKWEAQRREDARRRQEERRVESRKTSRKELLEVVEAWRRIVGLEGFFEDAERRVRLLPDEEQAPLLRRLGQARDLLGSFDALDHLRGWRPPEDVFQALPSW